MELTIYIPKITFWFLFPKYRSDRSHGFCIPINHFTDDVGIFNESIHNSYKAEEMPYYHPPWCKITSYICLIGMIEIRRDPSIVPAPSVIEWNSLFELSFQCLWNPSLERSFEELDFPFPFPIWQGLQARHMGFNLSNIIRHFTDSKSRWWNDVYYLGKRIEKWLESNSVFLRMIHELEIEKESYSGMAHFDYFFSTVEEIRNFVRSSESSKTQEGRNLSRYFNILDNSSHLNPRELSSKEYQLRGILNEKAF